MNLISQITRDTSQNQKLSASELLEKQLSDYTKEENKKITVFAKDNTYWTRDVSGNWKQHNEPVNNIQDMDNNNDIGRLL